MEWSYYVCSHFAGFIASMLVFLKARSLTFVRFVNLNRRLGNVLDKLKEEEVLHFAKEANKRRVEVGGELPRVGVAAYEGELELGVGRRFNVAAPLLDLLGLVLLEALNDGCVHFGNLRRRRANKV